MTLPATLVLERLPGRLRLYLGGDLQFDTADEAIYHERLAHPGVQAARSRFGTLDALVLGGGDGLLRRELLRHEAVRSIRLVDLNPEVIALARGELAPYNGGSLDDPRVAVTVDDARAVLDEERHYHLILSDLTFPTSVEDCVLFTRDWFARLHGRLHPGGVLALNGVSPETNPAAFWCLYQTLRAAGLHALPGRYHLPSFAALGYGSWGFFLASDRPIEITGAWPAGLTTLDDAALDACFRFPTAWAAQRLTARPACDSGRTLFEHLVEGRAAPAEDGELFSFLGFDDPVAPPMPAPAGALHPTLRAWLDRPPGQGIDDLLMTVPLSHRIVTRELIKDWSPRLLEVVAGLDLRRLVAALLRRGAALPRRLLDELRQVRDRLLRGERLVDNLTTWGGRFLSVLMLVLVLSQTASPTAAYGKGFSGGGYSGGYHGGSLGGYHRGYTRSHNSTGHPTGPGQSNEDALRRVIGLALLAGGGVGSLSAWNRIRERKDSDG